MNYATPWDLGSEGGSLSLCSTHFKQAPAPQGPHVLVGKMGLIAAVSAPHRGCVSCQMFLFLRLYVEWVPEPCFRHVRDSELWVASPPSCPFLFHSSVSGETFKKWFMSHVYGDHEDLKWLLFFLKWFARQTNVVNNNNNVIPGRRVLACYDLFWNLKTSQRAAWLLCNRVSFRLWSWKRLGWEEGIRERSN